MGEKESEAMILAFNILPVNMTWAQPLWFLLLPLIVFLFWRRQASPKHSGAFLLPEVNHLTAQKSLKKLIYKYAWVLLFLGLLGLVVAMARPQSIKTLQEYNGEGIEIMLAMDVSPSMLSLDFDPNRLEVSKVLATEFVKARQGDKIGLTVFSGEAYTKCPLTTDYQTLGKLLKELSPDNLQLGTAIGMGLATAINQLKDSPSKSKIIVLLTDGSNNRGATQPMEAASIARTLGIKVYTIGMGSGGIVNMPVQKKPDGTFIFSPVPSDFDESLLIHIAQNTGGEYFRARTKEELEAIYTEINKLERSKIKVTSHQIKTELFRPFLFIGLGLLTLYWLLLFLWIKPLP